MTRGLVEPCLQPLSKASDRMYRMYEFRAVFARRELPIAVPGIFRCQCGGTLTVCARRKPRNAEQ